MGLKDYEAQAAVIAQQFLATAGAATDPYTTAAAEFANIPRYKTDRVTEGVVGAVGSLLGTFGGEAPDVPKGEREDYIVAPSGAIRYANGVIYDPNAAAGQQILTPPGKAVPGSREWLLKVQEEWSDKEANEWRKKLAKQGYEVAETGGMAHDLLTALDEFHATRYANFGEVQPLIPQAGKEKDSIRGAIDKVALKQEIKTWGQVPFGEDLADDEADWFTDRIINVASRLAKKKGWAAADALAGAQTRVEAEFVKQPQVAGLIQEQQDQEVSYKVRDTIVGLDQLLGA